MSCVHGHVVHPYVGVLTGLLLAPCGGKLADLVVREQSLHCHHQLNTTLPDRGATTEVRAGVGEI